MYSVVVQFIIDTSGWVQEITPLTAHGYGMEAQLVRVIRESPPWRNAVVNGQPVNAFRKQPVTLRWKKAKEKTLGVIH